MDAVKQAEAAALREEVRQLKEARQNTIRDVYQREQRPSHLGDTDNWDVAGHPDVAAHDAAIREKVVQANILEREAMEAEG